jgi:3-dehydroquinate dehydratase-1
MICVSLADLGFEECREILNKIEMAELRLDLLDFSIDQIQALFSHNQKFFGGSRGAVFQKSPPVLLIATHRPTTISDDERKDILITAVEAGADYVDLESEADARFKHAVMKVCHRKNCKVIFSYHNYESTPSKAKLEKMIEACFAEGADIAKIACRVNDEADAARILSLYDREHIKEKQLVAIGMGEKGKITRLAAPLLGAPFTYACLSHSKETAPGQWDMKTLKDILDRIGGGLRRPGAFFEKTAPGP